MPQAKILIVEDEAIVARDIQRTLEKFGYLVAAIADNGLDAINLVKQKNPDLVLMDIILNGPIDGIETAEKINKMTKIPIVYLTGLQSEEILERSKATRPYGYLLKPLNERDLNSCLRLALYRFDIENKLRESEERYFRLADNARDMIFRMSITNGIYDYVNKACNDVTGYSQEDFYNNPMFISKIIHPDWKKYFNDEWEKLQKGELNPVYEFQIIDSSGNTRWLNQKNVIIKNEEGVPAVIEGIVTDITEQKNTEELLRKQSEEYRHMFEAIPAMVLVKDIGNKIIKVNTQAAEYMGISIKDLEGKNVSNFFPSEQERHETEDKGILTTGKPLLGIVESNEINGFGKTWLKYDKYPYRDEYGRIIGIIVMAQDISEQKMTEHALRESETKYRNLTHFAPVAFTRLMLGNNKYEIVNEEFVKQSGYTLEEFNALTNEQYKGIIYKDDRDKIQGEFSEWIKEGCKGIKNLVYRFINKHDEQIWLDSFHYADFDDKGKPHAVNQIYLNITDRKQYEDILSESKQYLDAFFSQSLDGIFIAKMSEPVKWDDSVNKQEILDVIFGDIRLTKVNQPLCEQFGMTEQQALRVHPLEYYRGNMGPVRKRWENFLDKGYLHVSEFYKKTNKEDIFIEGDYYCLYDQNKHFIGYIGIQRDMTQRKMAEESIKLSEEKFRAVAESIPAQVVIFQENNFVYVNPYSEIITGYNAEELVNMNYWDLVHEDHRELAKQRGMARQKGEEVPENYEMKIVTKQGSIKWISYSARVINFNGKPAVIGISVDITESKKYQEAVFESEERYRTFVEQSSEGIFRMELNVPVSVELPLDEIVNKINNDVYFAECNSVFSKMYGEENPADIIGKRPNQLKYTNIDENWRSIKFITNGYKLVEEETSEMDEEGSIRNFVTNAVGEIENGCLARIWGVQRDVTEKKKAEEALRRSLMEKEILLKEIHHRVKNNLQIVTSLLKLQSSYVNDENVKRLFMESQNRVQSMSMIHQKLYQTKDLSHIEFREYVETLTTHLQHSFGVLTDRVNICADVKNIVMSIDNAIPAGLIINELVSNSLKHAFPDGRSGEIFISIAYDEFNSEYWLVVRDNGTGMPENFDINNATSFGLKLVSTLVSQMEGTIEIFTKSGTEHRIIFKSADYKDRH